jgi:ABC-type Zn uptake system ZnuABC Zn-binding protein ZnuA
LVGPDGEPHAWLDPIRVRDTLAPRLAAWLTALDPAGESHYTGNLAGFQQRLTDLDAEIRALLAAAPGRHYVAYHAAWRPFAARYALEEVGVVEERPGAEPSPRELARLVNAARRAAVPAILVEPQLDARAARVIAAEFDGSTVMVDPLGDPSVPERASYQALLRFDARAFARALGGGEP